MTTPVERPKLDRPREDGTPRVGRLSSFLRRAWPHGLLLLLGLFVLLPGLGDFGFWDPWEPKYAQSVREMIERDSYVVPYFRGEARLAKPILTYWGILAGAALFGLNEFGARIVGVALGIVSMMSVYYAVAVMRGRQAGLLAAVVLGTLPQFYFLARQATPDIYLLTSLGNSLLFFCVGLFGPARRRNLHYGISYACFALALLSKGPFIAIPVFVVPLAIYLVAETDVNRLWQPDLRRRTTRFLSLTLPATIMLTCFSAAGLLLAGSPKWWETLRLTAPRMKIPTRSGFLVSLAPFRVAELALVLVIIALGLAAAWLYRHGGWRRGAIAAVAIPAAVSVTTLFVGETAAKLAVACAVMVLACSVVILVSIVSYIRTPALWSELRPYLKPVAKQVLLFTGIVVAIAGPWHLAVLLSQREGFVDEFVIYNNVRRATAKINRGGTSGFYLRTMLFGFFPWSCFIPIALASVVRWWDRDLLKRYGFEVYLLVSSAVVFALFGSAATKFSHYLAPMLIPMAVLIGLTLDRMLETPRSAATRVSWIVALMLYLVPMLELTRLQGSKRLLEVFTVKLAVPRDSGEGFLVLFVALAVIMLTTILVRSRLQVAAIVICAALIGNHANRILIPSVTTNKSMKYLCETWKDRGSGGELGFYGSRKFGSFYYTEDRVETLRSEGEFFDFMDPERSVWSIVEDNKLRRLEERYRTFYPGHELIVVNASHKDYFLVTSRVVEDDE